MRRRRTIGLLVAVLGPLAALLPVRLVRHGQSLAFELVDTGQRVQVLFPYGFTGRLVAGRAQLVAPEGVVLADEGDVLSGLGGSSTDNNDFVVCFTSPDEYRSVVTTMTGHGMDDG